MNVAQRADITAFRNDDFQQLVTFFGADLTGVPLSLAIKLDTDVPGAAIMTLTSDVGGGITIIDTAALDDGTPYSVIQMFKAKADFVTLFTDYPAPEPGRSAIFSFDLQWVAPSALVAPATPAEETILYGTFILAGSVNA